jgi:DNA (cytosine-5)-methyltransferase 1
MKFVDLFCGIGGFHQGIKNVIPNSECVLASDIDDKVRETYELNYGIKPYGDITQLDVTQMPSCDMICGGFPCQPFSVAQWKDAKAFNDPRGNMFFEILKIVDGHKPSCLFLENVANLTTINNGEVFKVIIDALKDRGYYVSHQVLNVKNFGVPQNRERVYIIASLEKEFDFSELNSVNIPNTIENILDRHEHHEYIDPSKYTLLSDEHVKQQSKSGLMFKGYINGNIRKKGARENTEHLSRVHKQPMRIYSTHGTHPTLSASESSGRYHIYDERNCKVRKLTLKECYKLMAFPDEFKYSTKSGTAYKHIGNSVCVRVIEFILKEIVRQKLLKI